MLQCVDEGWDTKEDSGVVCRVQVPSIYCKYMIGSQNFILTFYYRRWHLTSGRMVPLEQDMDNIGEDPVIDIDIFYNNSLIFNISMRARCTLRQIQDDLSHEDIQLPPKFFFNVNGRKVTLFYFPTKFCHLHHLYWTCSIPIHHT